MMGELILLQAITLPESWVDDALCPQVDPAIFYPDQGQASAEAKKICSSCPVVDPCLEYALRVSEPDGVWGGLSRMERRTIRRETDTVFHNRRAGRRVA